MVAVQYQATLQFMRMGRVRRRRRRARVPAPGGYAPRTHMAVDGELYTIGTRGALSFGNIIFRDQISISEESGAPGLRPDQSPSQI